MGASLTVADSKRAFHTAFPHVIAPLYRRLVDELLVELHLLSHQSGFEADGLFAVGLTQVFDSFSKGYKPELQREPLFAALCSATGFDVRRMNMLLAVLEKRAGFRFGTKDVFLNIAGGLRVEDPAIDLAVIAALCSSYNDISVSNKIAFAAEVGLSGEVRAVSRIEQRIGEADKLGFEKIFISKFNQKIDAKKFNLEIVYLSKVQQLMEELFG